MEAEHDDLNENSSTENDETTENVEITENGDASGNFTPNNDESSSSDQNSPNDNHIESNDSNEEMNEKAEDKSPCLLRISFRDDSTFDELHQTVGKCIRDALFSLKKSLNVVVKRDEICMEILEIPDNDNNDSLFMIDTIPTDRVNERTEVPNYKTGSDVLNNDKIEPATNEDDDKPKGMCWNCNGNHTLRDCKKPRDQDAINRGKQLFAQKGKTERYHLDTEQKFGQFVPGKISDSLRSALGLRSRELPLYIYKMRLYGYPPGWLEEAKVAHSGLTLFNAEART